MSAAATARICRAANSGNIRWACAASSMTRSPYFLASARSGSMSAGWPKRWTGMIARVSGVIACSPLSGSRLKVAALTSARRGVPPAAETPNAVAMNVSTGDDHLLTPLEPGRLAGQGK